MTVDEWDRHPDQGDVPKDLSYAVRCWLTEHGEGAVPYAGV